ncbi:MAG TPA: DUF3226 domain-containing protein [Candidatus Binataceae bacterium]|nr:DUF3226 domain-containing protein [Candidatus Binataceae bacterium]
MPDSQLTLPLPKEADGGYRFQHSLVIICEGLSDREFFRRFIAARNLPHFDIPFPHDPGDDSIEKQKHIFGGKKRFPNMLRATKAADNIKGVLLVIDSADDPNATLNEARQYIQDAGDYAVPSTFMQLATDGDAAPPVAIATMPPNEPGGLETLCYQAMVRANGPIGGCIETLCGSANVNSWNPEKQGKARLQCMVAVLNQEDPNKALRYVFTLNPPLIPLTDSAFDVVEKLLRDFAQLAGVTI